MATLEARIDRWLDARDPIRREEPDGLAYYCPACGRAIRHMDLVELTTGPCCRMIAVCVCGTESAILD